MLRNNRLGAIEQNWSSDARKNLRVLIVDNSAGHAETIVRHLQENGHAPVFERATDMPALARLLQEKTWDIVLSDHKEPGFNSLRALETLQQSGFDIPFIIVSEQISTEEVVAVLRAGARDFIPKNDFSRLIPAIERELRQTQLRCEHREVQEAIARSEAHYRSLIESSPGILVIFDTQGSSKYISPSVYEVLGYSPNEMLGTKFTEWIHPEDLAKALSIFQYQLQHPEERLREQFRVRHKNGAWRLMNVAATFRINPLDQPEVIGSLSDVTELVASEQYASELKLMLDQAQEAVVVRDLETRILYFNKGAERITGYSAGEMVGKILHNQIYDPADLERVKNHVLKAGEWAGELPILGKNKNSITLDTHWTLIRDPQGLPKSILTISTDITEKKKLEDQCLRAQRMESIGALASGIAHDLNNVLTPMMMCLPLLREKVQDPALQSLTQTLECSLERGSAILKQLLSFGRGFEGSRKVLELPGLLSELKEIVRQTFPKNIQVKLNCGEKLWQIFGDTTQLHQVLLNLCINARDAMPAGGEPVD